MENALVALGCVLSTRVVCCLLFVVCYLVLIFDFDFSFVDHGWKPTHGRKALKPDIISDSGGRGRMEGGSDKDVNSDTMVKG